MRKVFLLVLTAGAFLMIMGVIIFHYFLSLAWIDALYFVITIMTTIGFGDISIVSASVPVKIFGMFLMVAGAACMASAFGIITDFLVKSRIEELFGLRRKKMKDHIILCGLGNVGFRILQWLHQLDEKVLIIEKDDNAPFLKAVKGMKAPVVIGDINMPETLDRASISTAKCLIAASNKDIVNIEAALNARSENEKIRCIIRIFDQNLAGKLQTGMTIDAALSTSALAAPAFAFAAVDPSVVSSFFVGNDLMLNIELTIEKNSSLDGMSTPELISKGDFAVIAHESSKTGKRTLNPSKSITLHAGDKIIIATPKECSAALHKFNR